MQNRKLVFLFKDDQYLKKNKIESMITRVFSMFVSILVNHLLNLKPYLRASFQIRFDHPGGNESSRGSDRRAHACTCGPFIGTRGDRRQGREREQKENELGLQ